MGKFGTMAMVLGGISLAGTLSGCGSFGNSEDIAQINKNMQQQQRAIDKLCVQVESNGELLKKLTASTANEQDMRARLIAAALLLAENGSENIPSQAINILGYIGGEKAEDALIKMLDSKPSMSNSVIQALANMRSKKLHDIVIKMLQDSDSNRLGSVANIINNGQYNIFTDADLPVLEKMLTTLPDNDYNNNRYLRNSLIGAIFRIAPGKGIKYVCDSLITTSEPYRRRDIIYQICNNNIKLRTSDWQKIIECIGPISSLNIDAYGAMLNGMQRSGDWRFTDIIMPWAEYAKTNHEFGNQYFSALTQIRDPKAASIVVELLKNKELRPYGRNLNNFPGIKQVNGEYVQDSDAEMEKLLANRAKVIEKLNEMDKKAEGIK